MLYQKSYTFVYILLIAISIFAPEVYGVTLKHAIIPLALMVLLSYLGKLRLTKIKSYVLICMFWILLVIYSTYTSEIIDWSPSARSFCLLILFFILLYEKVPSERHMNIIKHVYIYLTFFCAIWIILQSFTGIDRHEFIFVTGPKDVNYLAAFMLPGVYMALRFLMFEKQKQKFVYILCVGSSFYGMLLIQSRAAFITIISVILLSFIEYLVRSKLSLKKITFFLFAIALIVIVGSLIWNNSSFSRLTAAESYENDVRLTIWEHSFRAFTDSPIIGSGLGASSYLSEIATGYESHCNYLDILGDTGVLGMTLFLLLSIKLLKTKKGHRLHMFTYYVACMLPLGFINGLHTISFWVPMLLLAHEHTLIERRHSNDWNNHITP